jgi:hypothetical protein
MREAHNACYRKRAPLSLEEAPLVSVAPNGARRFPIIGYPAPLSIEPAALRFSMQRALLLL